MLASTLLADVCLQILNKIIVSNFLHVADKRKKLQSQCLVNLDFLWFALLAAVENRSVSILVIINNIIIVIITTVAGW